jgi:ABC-2 type transport system permease protein
MMTNTATGFSPTSSRSTADDIALAGRQILYDQRSFWRNRSRAFFAFLLPIMFLVIFGSLNRGDTLEHRGDIAADLFIVPGLLAYGLIMATFTNLATDLAISRESGVLKRMRGTPLPRWAFLSGRIGSATLTAMAVTVVTLLVGGLAYDVHVRLETLPGLVLGLAFGTACFSALGIGVNRLIPNADAAPAVANGLILPLTFISGVWGDFGPLPTSLQRLAETFPIQHLANALQVAFDPRTAGPGIVWSDLLNLTVWGALGVLAGLRWLHRDQLHD